MVNKENSALHSNMEASICINRLFEEMPSCVPIPTGHLNLGALLSVSSSHGLEPPSPTSHLDLLYIITGHPMSHVSPWSPWFLPRFLPTLPTAPLQMPEPSRAPSRWRSPGRSRRRSPPAVRGAAVMWGMVMATEHRYYQ